MKLIAEHDERLDRFLARLLPEHSRSRLAEWISEGKVLVQGKPRKPSFALEAGMEVELDAPADRGAHDLTPHTMHLSVPFEDEQLLVVDKPRGLATHPAASLKEPSLVNALLGRGTELSQGSESFRPGIVHRLDRDTTGLLVIAKTDLAHRLLAAQMEDKRAERRYFAVVAGDLSRERFAIDAPLGRDPRHRTHMAVTASGKPSRTHVKRVARADFGTLVALRLETGRTHQIRVHLATLGHPVLGDDLYAPKEYRTGPLQLHAAYLAFDHPVTGERVGVYSTPPEDFLARDWCDREAIEEF